MNQTMASYYNPAAAAYGPLSAASMAAAAAAAQQSAAMSAGLGAPPQVNINSCRKFNKFFFQIRQQISHTIAMLIPRNKFLLSV